MAAVPAGNALLLLRETLASVLTAAMSWPYFEETEDGNLL